MINDINDFHGLSCLPLIYFKHFPLYPRDLMTRIGDREIQFILYPGELAYMQMTHCFSVWGHGL